MKNNPERNRERAAEWYQQNKERRKEYRRSYYEANKDKIKERKRLTREADPERQKDLDKWYRIKCLYGLSKDQYQDMYDSQLGCCKICKKPESNLPGGLHIDHCHSTLKVRGLLCGNCNKGLGLFFDDSTFLDNALKYLEENKR